MSENQIQTETQKESKTLPDAGYFIENEYKYKFATPWVEPIDCTRYLSNSGLSFNGCYKVEKQGNNITEMRELQGGLFYSFHEPKIMLKGRAKITRDKKEIPQIIENLLKYIQMKSDREKFIVKYDNFYVSVYDKYKRAKDVDLEKEKHVHIEYYDPYILKIYRLSYTLNEVDDEYLTNEVTNPIKIVSDGRKMIELWTDWKSYSFLLINNDNTELRIEDDIVNLDEKGLYLIFVKYK